MGVTRILASNRVFRNKIVIFGVGVLIGFIIPNRLSRLYKYRARIKPCASIGRILPNDVIFGRPRQLSEELETKQLLFAGVMTAERFLQSRAKVVYDTWGNTIPGKVAFFAGNRSGRSRIADSLNVVTLNGVDDSYPPQRKSFMMLKYMHDNFINDYEWFMRCDDDVYVRTDKLAEMLRSFQSSEDLFIGQAGQGRQSERGRLGLGPDDNFCMGGPGMVLSRSALKKLAPHVEYCLNNMMSKHEDVEIGRCVKRHVGISCTWAFEMQWTFYHNQSKSNAYQWDLDTKAVQNAITLHPIKNPAYMYRIHMHFSTEKILKVQHKSTMKLNTIRNLRKLTRITLTKTELTQLRSKRDLFQNVRLNTTHPWELFSPYKLYSIESGSTVTIEYSMRRALNSVLRSTLASINLDARKLIFRELMLSKVNLGYMRLLPTQGLQYIFDLRLVMYRHIGYSRRKLPINVQYQAHMQNPFGNIIYTSRSVKTQELPTLNIILPLAERFAAFARFLANFERTVLLSNEKVKLLIMYFPKQGNSNEHQRILRSYTTRYPMFQVIWKTVDGDFSRGLALQHGVAQFSTDSLLFFCDVDLAFNVEFLQRCRLNTDKGKRVYYPMVFSEYNETVSTQENGFRRKKKEQELRFRNLKEDYGFWRKYGFGIMCVYAEDVHKVGGFDLNIKGWGLEDVKLYERFLATGRYDVIRAPDPGLVHNYHESNCSPDLEARQLLACHNSARSQIASARSLVKYMESRGYL